MSGFEEEGQSGNPATANSEDIEGIPLRQPQTILKKTAVVLTVATSALVLALMVSSFSVLNHQQKYEGILSPHLPIYSGEIEYSRMPA